MIHLMLATTVHVKEMRHPPFQFSTFAAASKLLRESIDQGFLHVEDVFIQIGEGTVAHIVSDDALALTRERGLIVDAWNLLICPPGASALPPMPFATKEAAESAIERGLQRMEVGGIFGETERPRQRHLSFVRMPDHDEFHYISAPGTIVLVLSKEDCVKRLAASGETKSKLVV